MPQGAADHEVHVVAHKPSSLKHKRKRKLQSTLAYLAGVPEGAADHEVHVVAELADVVLKILITPDKPRAVGLHSSKVVEGWGSPHGEVAGRVQLAETSSRREVAQCPKHPATQHTRFQPAHTPQAPRHKTQAPAALRHRGQQEGVQAPTRAQTCRFNPLEHTGGNLGAIREARARGTCLHTKEHMEIFTF